MTAVSALRIAEFLLCNNTDHGCFSSETVIFIEIYAMCINYQFWIILKNLSTSLNQSGVSMIIAESSKDVNQGKNRSMEFLHFSMHFSKKINKLLQQQWKHSKYMYAKCLNCLCFVNYLPALINELYKKLRQVELESMNILLYAQFSNWNKIL